MQIAVLIEQVPPTDIRPKIGEDKKSLVLEGVKRIISPYDEYAIEEALRWKEKEGGEVVLITAGPARCDQALREGLAMGADKAVRVDVPEGYYDPWQIANLLAPVVKELSPDIIFAGKMGVGDDHHQVGAMLAECLGLPHVGAVVSIYKEGNTLTLHREIEGATEVLETSLPCLITCEKGLNEPRYASLKGIMAAKRKPIDVKTGTPVSPTLQLIQLELPKPKARGKVVKPETPEEGADLIVNFLKEEAKML